MSDLRKAAQQALEFVTSEVWGKTPYMDVCVYEDAARLRDALRAALAQQPEPGQEPVGEMRLSEIIEGMVVPVVPAELPVGTKLYAAPPQRPPLTDEEMLGIIDDAMEGGSLLDVARAIERKARGEKE